MQGKNEFSHHGSFMLILLSLKTFSIEPYAENPKVAFLGDEQVGKTCFLNQLRHAIFEKAYFPTAGVDFFVLTIKDQKIQFWDTVLFC